MFWWTEQFWVCLIMYSLKYSIFIVYNLSPKVNAFENYASQTIFSFSISGCDEIVWGPRQMWGDSQQATVYMWQYSNRSRYTLVCDPHKVWWGMTFSFKKLPIFRISYLQDIIQERWMCSIWSYTFVFPFTGLRGSLQMQQEITTRISQHLQLHQGRFPDPRS